MQYFCATDSYTTNLQRLSYFECKTVITFLAKMSTRLRENQWRFLHFNLLSSSKLAPCNMTFSEHLIYILRRSSSGQSILKAATVPRNFQQLLCEMNMLVLIYKFMTHGMQRPKVSKNNHFISHILKGTIYNPLSLQEVHFQHSK